MNDRAIFLGCAGMWGGLMFFGCFLSMIIGGETLFFSLVVALMMGGLGIFGAVLLGLFGLLNAHAERAHARRVGRNLGRRAPISDQEACEPISPAHREVFLSVRELVAERLRVPPDRLRASDRLKEDFDGVNLWGIGDRLLKTRGLSMPRWDQYDQLGEHSPDLTLADFAADIGRLLDLAKRLATQSGQSESRPSP